MTDARVDFCKRLVEVAESMSLEDYEDLREEIKKDGVGFWSSIAGKFFWTKKFSKVKDSDIPWKWFADGEIDYGKSLFEGKEEGNVLCTVYGEKGQIKKYTCRDIKEEIAKFQGIFRKVGGGRVIICLRDKEMALFAGLACLLSERFFGFLYHKLPPELMVRLCNEVDASCLIYDPIARSGIGDPDFSKMDSIRDVIIPFEGSEINPKGKNLWYLKDAEDFKFESIPRKATDPTLILFSSGTTGVPKPLATGTAGTYVVNAAVFMLTFPKGGKNLWSTLDLAWAPEFVFSSFQSLMAGSGLIITKSKFDPGSDDFYRVVENEKITFLMSAPVFFEGIRKIRKKVPIERVILGGSWINEAVWENCRNIFVESSFVMNGYGSSEFSTMCFSTIPASLGRENRNLLLPLPWIDYKINGEKEGQLLVGAGLPSICVGKIRNGKLQDVWESGSLFLSSGDRAKKVEGLIGILGRMDGAIKIKGRHVNVAAIEESLCGIEGVTGVKFIVNNDSSRFSVVYIETEVVGIEDNVREVLVKRFGQYVVPEKIVPVVSLRRAGSGKISDENDGDAH